MEQQLLDRITQSDRLALANVLKHLQAAHAAWNEIDSGKQCEINATHHEESSLAHCLRWGVQAVEELLQITNPPAGTEQPIQAKAHDDDHRFLIEFDARPWFEQATNQQLMALYEIGWTGDAASDAVAEYFEGKNGFPDSPVDGRD